MRERLILLPGWALGVAPLEPLAAALRSLNPQLDVEVQALPELDSHAPADWLDALDTWLPMDAWLGGWSLGGMLAAQLVARRGAGSRGLISLGSNACFVAREDWPWAMPEATFQAFVGQCTDDPQQILKRFALLCSQGAADARSLSRLLATAPGVPPLVQLAGLQVLAGLDNRSALRGFSGQQLHLLAESDGLVPQAAADALRGLLVRADVRVLEQAPHAFVLSQADQLAALIDAFIREAEA